MVWPFGKKRTKQEQLIDDVAAAVQAGDFNRAYDLMTDAKGIGIFLLTGSIETYRKQFQAVHSVLGRKDVDKAEALAALAMLKTRLEELYYSIDRVR